MQMGVIIQNNKSQHTPIIHFVMPNKDHYQLLQVPISASPEEIKRAYRKLAYQYHPDKTGEDKTAAAYFTQILS